ncbi:hypothetical protein H696_05001 [Fonticula alba]|uniref:Elongation of fatty acids protein n=1 Tax=Fonticula alba TaxID=691883 RepID=A0A058Z459_FONAL|nr:hypothetical protein H696_05001 [Fonticula alba]KCV68713.1 hypothetical protein H696_05001 [Fonticula alba]|eukprot:XP_009497145.1 hypothetical protein H696_05001 [Fonticula alba]
MAVSEKPGTNAVRARPPHNAFAASILSPSIIISAAVTLGLLETVWKPVVENFKFERLTLLHEPKYPIIATLGYVLMLIFLPMVMKNRQPLNLKWVMVIHNWILSTGSLVMTIGMLKEVALYALKNPQWVHLTCDPNYTHRASTNLFFWYYIFYLSKMYEFIDTAILILRKKNVIFLHWYHHIITLWLCWVCLDVDLGIQWFSSASNTLVHVFMYYFYASQTLNIQVSWKKHLTTLQIVQFVLGISSNLSWAYFTIIKGITCSGNWFSFWFGKFVLVSFLVLFIQFYRRSYKKKPVAAATKTN